MYIESIHITAFAALQGYTLTLSDGLNVLKGRNESGKSTVAEFIRFVLYGFDGKVDRERYTGFSSSSAEGSLILCDKDKRYRVERKVAGTKEVCGVYDLDTGSRLFEGQVPGEALLGVPAGLFVSTAFVGQTAGSRIDGRATSEAVENLLFSGDEGISVKKALKRLDDARVALLHKNRKGGRIWDLENEISAQKVLLAEATDGNAEILSLESSIAELKRKLADEERDFAELEARLEDFKIMELRRQNQKLAELADAFHEATSLAVTHKETYTRNGFFPDGEYLESLKNCGGEIGRRDARVKEIEADLQKLNLQIEKARTEKEELDREEERKKALLSAKRGTALAAAVLCCILFLCAALGTALMFMTAKEGAGTVFAIVTVLLMGGMVGGFVLVSRYAAAMRDMVHIIGNREDIFKDRLERIGKELSAAREERSKYKRMLDDLCGKWNLIPTAKALNELAWVIQEERRVTFGQEKARLAYVQMKTEVEAQQRASELEDDGREISIPEDFQPKEAVRKRDLLKELIRSKREHCQRFEVRLAQLTATAVPPSAISERITALEYERDTLKSKYDAYVLASEKLAEAGETVRASISPKLSQAAGALMDTVTDGKYAELGVDGAFAMTFRPETENGGRMTQDERFMSAGTSDAAYISLRMALAELIGKSESALPLIFDESFARLDDQRLANLLKLLSVGGRQCLLFTSCGREAGILKGLGLPHVTLSLNR